VQQDLVLGFDSGTEALSLSPGDRSVTTHSSGLGSREVANAVNGAVHQAVAGIVAAICTDSGARLANILGKKSELIVQLRTLDDNANAGFGSAEFVPDGVVLRGTIAATGRKPPVIRFDKTLESENSLTDRWSERFDALDELCGSSTTPVSKSSDNFQPAPF